jgi:uncharacterized protein YndB with AHSA1/START domain
MTDTGRRAEVELDLDATLEDAWRAITDARELARWFPLEARVEPGAGGTMEWIWADKFHWTTRIETWQPPRLLRLVQDAERPHDVEGRQTQDQSVAPARMVIEFLLETSQGRTHLRLVHSGFGAGAAWDDELESVRNGWATELRNLALYLARHRGKDRHVAWATGSTAEPQAAVWRRLLGPGGFAIEAHRLAAGEPFTLRTPGGDTLSGIIQLHIPDREFLGIARELDDGVFRLGTWAAAGATGVHVWLATWSPELEGKTAALGATAQRFLDRTFAAAATPAGTRESSHP